MAINLGPRGVLPRVPGRTFLPVPIRMSQRTAEYSGFLDPPRIHVVASTRGEGTVARCGLDVRPHGRVVSKVRVDGSMITGRRGGGVAVAAEVQGRRVGRARAAPAPADAAAVTAVAYARGLGVALLLLLLPGLGDGAGADVFDLVIDLPVRGILLGVFTYLLGLAERLPGVLLGLPPCPAVVGPGAGILAAAARGRGRCFSGVLVPRWTSDRRLVGLWLLSLGVVASRRGGRRRLGAPLSLVAVERRRQVGLWWRDRSLPLRATIVISEVVRASSGLISGGGRPADAVHGAALCLALLAGLRDSERVLLLLQAVAVPVELGACKGQVAPDAAGLLRLLTSLGGSAVLPVAADAASVDLDAHCCCGLAFPFRLLGLVSGRVGCEEGKRCSVDGDGVKIWFINHLSWIFTGRDSHYKYPSTQGTANPEDKEGQ